MVEKNQDQELTRKSIIFISEILKLSSKLLPSSRFIKIQSLSKLFDLATRFDDEILRNAATEALSYIYYSNKSSNHSSSNSKVSKNSIIQIDDNQFRNMLIETQVLTTKDYTKWEVKPIMELLQKILLNPRRLEESIKINFIKSLLVFLSPNSRLFSDIVRSEENEKKYVDVGCTLLTTLLNNSYGVKYLEKKSFLRHISDCLNQLIPMNGISESEPLFSKDQINKTLTFGYFKIIGILCKCKEGLRLLEKFKILNTFYQLSELNGREDIIKSIINNLDYSMQRVRLYSTNYLGILLKKTEKNLTEWAVQLLITQLYDPMIEVCQMAIKILEELCDRNIDNIELMIKYRPYLDHLGEFGNNLLLKFLSTPIGFNYLYEINYLERELIDWFNVIFTFIFILRLGSCCQMLRDKGHFTEFSNYIKNHGMEDTNYPIIKKLKSVLWAVGNIGSSKNGLTFLDEENIIKEIVHIAENSNVLSLRGTCYYVLGLISKTLKGVEILKDLGWERADVILQENAMQKPIPSFETEKILLKTVSNLTNHILSNIESTTSLSKIKSRNPEIFTNFTTYYKVIQMLSIYQYKLPARRYITELFHIDFNSKSIWSMKKLPCSTNIVMIAGRTTVEEHLSPPATLLVTQIQILLVDIPCEKQKNYIDDIKQREAAEELHLGKLWMVMKKLVANLVETNIMEYKPHLYKDLVNDIQYFCEQRFGNLNCLIINGRGSDIRILLGLFFAFVIAWLTLLCQRMLAPLQNVFALTVLKTRGLTLPIVSMLKQAFYMKIKIVY
nr:1987_t:CDS:10 [Entrophospora candida]